jgi:hypothetical protein
MGTKEAVAFTPLWYLKCGPVLVQAAGSSSFPDVLVSSPTA